MYRENEGRGRDNGLQYTEYRQGYPGRDEQNNKTDQKCENKSNDEGKIIKEKKLTNS
jgi:hypothetical protein